MTHVRGRRFIERALVAKTSSLREAIQEAGEDTSIRVWCEVYADEMLTRWEKSNGLRPYHGGPEKLLGKHDYDSGLLYIPPEGHDHCQLWGLNRKPLVFTMQPYMAVDMTKLVQWATPLGLCVDLFCECSWHFPTRTALIELTTVSSRSLLYEHRLKLAGIHREQ